MQAVILAAGKGTRMWPLTSMRPKSLLPIANKPIIEHIIISAREAGVNKFVLVIEENDTKTCSYFDNGKEWGIYIEYCRQKQATGTASALGLVKQAVSDRFLVFNGDMIISSDDIRKLCSETQTTIGVVQAEDTAGYGVVEGSNGIVHHIFEKPENSISNLVNAGAYLMTKQIFSAIAQTKLSCREEFELTQSLELIIRDGIPVCYKNLEQWQDMSFPWNLLDANAHILSGLEPLNHGIIEDNVHIEGACHIGNNSIIRSGSYIIGPVCIGSGCDIGPNCYIRPSTSIGDYCHIGAGVEIKNSIIMCKTKIPHLSYVGDSIIGENCNIGAGTKIANLRLDRDNIFINGYNTKRHKMGAVLGDHVMTGINCSINTGTVIGSNSWLGPNLLATGVIPENSHVSPTATF